MSAGRLFHSVGAAAVRYMSKKMTTTIHYECRRMNILHFNTHNNSVTPIVLFMINPTFVLIVAK